MYYCLWIIKIDFTDSPLEFSDWKKKKEIKKEKVSQERHALLIYY